MRNPPIIFQMNIALFNLLFLMNISFIDEFCGGRKCKNIFSKAKTKTNSYALCIVLYVRFFSWFGEMGNNTIKQREKE